LSAELRLFEIAVVLVHFYHVASIIVNANHGIMGTAAVHRVANGVADRIRLAVPQPTERQNIGNEINAARLSFGTKE
jgi:hypothetical protein